MGVPDGAVTAPGILPKSVYAEHNVDMETLWEPRVAIANSIRDFTEVRAAVGPGPTLGTDCKYYCSESPVHRA